MSNSNPLLFVKGQTKFTPEQEALIETIKQEYIDLVEKSGKDLSYDEVAPQIEKLYAYVNKPRPIILILADPMSCQLALNIFWNSQLGSQLGSQLYSQLRSQLGSQLYSQLDSQLGSQLGSQLDSQLGSQLYSQLGSQLYSQLRSQLYSQLDSQLYSQLGSQLRSQLGSQLGSQLDSQLDSQLYSQLGSQLYSQLRSQLYSQLDSQLRSQLGSQLYSQLRSQLGSQLGSQLDSQLYSQLGSQLGSQLLKYFGAFGGLPWKSYWLAWYDFCYRIGMSVNQEIDQKAKEYIGIWKTGIYDLIIFDGLCIVCKLPISVKRDNQKRLHSVTEPAIKFRSGYSLFAIHGVVFEDQELWENITQRKLTTKQVMQIKNTEQRRVAINHYGWDVIFDELDAKLINKSKRKTSLAELYRVKGLAENIEINLVKYKDRSTERWYVSQVPDVDDYSKPIKTADHAMAWKSWLTLEEYQKELRIEA